MTLLIDYLNNNSNYYLSTMISSPRLSDTWRIMVKFHRENTTSLCGRAQFGCIPKHFRQRNHRTDCLGIARADFHALDHAAAAFICPITSPRIFFRDNNFNLHDRLKQNWAAFCTPSLKRHRSSHLEGHFTRVNFMERTIDTSVTFISTTG